MVAKFTHRNTDTTDIFNGKTVPTFLQNNIFFDKKFLEKNPAIKPTKLYKIFPAIGLSNFKDTTNIPQSMSDLKKEGSYVWNILQDISTESGKLKDLVGFQSQKTQFLAPIEERLAKKEKLNEVAKIISALTSLQEVCDPRAGNPFHVHDGVVNIGLEKIELRLAVNISDGNGKVLYKAGIPIFRVFNRLRDKCSTHGVPETSSRALESLISYKVFSTENIPNKKLSIVFSSDGEEGAWDLMTMSMRGIRSCQRWEGEYPKCLIGSVLSRFVGIMYLTAGTKSEAYGDFDDMGSSMMRRSIVRFAFDKDAGKPCLVLDKMYPSEEDRVIKIFMDSLSERSKLPVYYGPHLALKTKHIYLPNEKLMNKLSFRERSYQDTALRTKSELDAHILVNNRQELSKCATNTKFLFENFLMEKFYGMQSSKKDSYLSKMISNVVMSCTLSNMAGELAQSVLQSFLPPQMEDSVSYKSYHKQYLKKLFMDRKNLLGSSKGPIKGFLNENCSYDFDIDLVMKEFGQLFNEFIKSEFINSIKDK